MNRKKLIVVGGPTAIGKTDHAIRLARNYACPVISADSRQVYRELNIGVARPDEIQLAAAEHHLIAHVSIHDEYNAGIYAVQARTLINRLFHTHDTLIMCGGTGLYIRAALQGLDPLPPRNEELRAALETLLAEEGLQALQNKLEKLDPQRYSRTEILNPQRLIRAIEIASSGKAVQSILPPFETRFDIVFDIMECPRDVLYQRINQRVLHMLELGLEAEAASLYPLRNLQALQTVGYSEWWPYFEGLCSIEQVCERIQQHSRNYAKRQITWFKHQILKMPAAGGGDG